MLTQKKKSETTLVLYATVLEKEAMMEALARHVKD